MSACFVKPKQKFGRLVILNRVNPPETRKNKKVVYWECVCECGNKIICSSSELTTGNTKSCGCYRKEYFSKIRCTQKIQIGNKYNLLTVTHKDSSRNGRAFWECRCDCGKSCSVDTTRLLTGHTKSCGCLNERLRRERRGKKHPNFNPLLTQEDREHKRINQQNREWELKVFNKNQFKCQICSSSGKLSAHHLDGYHWCQEKRLDESNGVTLCYKCHQSFHNQYGRKNNTKEQYLEWSEKCQRKL